jgi:hypothetical protein
MKKYRKDSIEERVSLINEKVSNDFETDLFVYILTNIEEEKQEEVLEALQDISSAGYLKGFKGGYLTCAILKGKK